MLTEDALRHDDDQHRRVFLIEDLLAVPAVR